jgi:hypothetical protein
MEEILVCEEEDMMQCREENLNKRRDTYLVFFNVCIQPPLRHRL